jgi:hypothetical protein
MTALLESAHSEAGNAGAVSALEKATQLVQGSTAGRSGTHVLALLDTLIADFTASKDKKVTYAASLITEKVTHLTSFKDQISANVALYTTALTQELAHQARQAVLQGEISGDTVVIDAKKALWIAAFNDRENNAQKCVDFMHFFDGEILINTEELLVLKKTIDIIKHIDCLGTTDTPTAAPTTFPTLAPTDVVAAAAAATSVVATDTPTAFPTAAPTAASNCLSGHYRFKAVVFTDPARYGVPAYTDGVKYNIDSDMTPGSCQTIATSHTNVDGAVQVISHQYKCCGNSGSMYGSISYDDATTTADANQLCESADDHCDLFGANMDWVDATSATGAGTEVKHDDGRYNIHEEADGTTTEPTAFPTAYPTPQPTSYPTEPAPTTQEAAAQTSSVTTEVTLQGVTTAEFTTDVKTAIEQAVAAQFEVHVSQVTVEVVATTRRRLTAGLNLRVTIEAAQGKVVTVQTEMQQIAEVPALKESFAEVINEFLVAEAEAEIAAASTAAADAESAATAAAAVSATAAATAADDDAAAAAAAEAAAAAAATAAADADNAALAVGATAAAVASAAAAVDKAAADAAATAAAEAAAAATATAAAAATALAAVPAPIRITVEACTSPVVVTGAPTAYPTAYPTASPTKAPVNCATSGWGSWDTCSATCGTGFQTHTRTVTTEAANGGAACGALAGNRECNTGGCSVADATASPTKAPSFCAPILQAAGTPDASCLAGSGGCSFFSTDILLTSRTFTTCAGSADAPAYTVKYHNPTANPVTFEVDTCSQNTTFQTTAALYSTTSYSCSELGCSHDRSNAARAPVCSDSNTSWIAHSIGVGETVLVMISSFNLTNEQRSLWLDIREPQDPSN